MTYIELINRFWDFYGAKKFADIDTVVYFTLLDECNIRRWLNPLELHTCDLEARLRISRKTIAEVRNRLKQRGLIDFKPGKGRTPTVYLIDGIDVTNGLLSVHFNVSPREHKGNIKVTLGKHYGNIRVTQSENTPCNKEDYIRHIDNTPPNPPKGDETGECKTPSLFEEKKSRHPLKRAKSPESPPPTLEEVKAYFLSQRADERLSDWLREAETFFNHFTSLGWKTSAGAKITRWDSRANLWIIEHEVSKKTDKTKSYEAERDDRLSGRRGTEPSAKSRKDFKGTF